MTEEKPKRPTHIIWQVIGDGKDAPWIRIGAAWPNRDGKGFNLKLDAFPVVGHIVARLNTEVDDDAPQA